MIGFTTRKETNYPYASQTPIIVQHKQEAKLRSSTTIPDDPSLTREGVLFMTTAIQLHKGLHKLHFCVMPRYTKILREWQTLS